MLMHYSPYKVAENFRLLESLYPGRIDLGLGRAPGSNPIQAGALAYGSKTTGPEFFTTKMNDLKSFLIGENPETEAFESVDVTPGLGSLPETWLLVSSENGADLAALFGLPMSLAHFIEQDCLHLADRYRKNFKPSVFSNDPKVSVGIFAICAESDEEALRLSASASAWRRRVQSGKASSFPLVEEALSEINIESLGKGETRPFVGSQDTIYERLKPLIKKVDPEELKIITICEPFDAKAKSYKLIKDLFD
jgi:luciferase family oxidoreductase group 1